MMSLTLYFHLFHQVWLIGEYSRATFDERCSPEVVTKFYELLEALVYEVSGLIQATPTSEPSPYSARLVSAMMSALAKVSTSWLPKKKI